MDFITPVFEITFKYFNPTLFQNVILGILAILIPFMIRFLNNDNYFEKLVFEDEVIRFRYFFLYSILGLVFFSFFDLSSSDENVFYLKTISFFIGSIIVFKLSDSILRLWKYLDDEKFKFQKKYLNRINASDNNFNPNRLGRIWNAIWSEVDIENERDFTEIFISHMDDLITHSRYSDAINIFRIYLKNIKHRKDVFITIYNLYPKVLEWQRILFEDKKYQKKNVGTGHVSWRFFQNQAMPAFVKLNTSEFGDFSSLFDITNKFINKWDADAKDENERWLLSEFFKKFLNEIFLLSSSSDESSEFIPEEWKISYKNSNNRISSFFFQIFIGNVFINEKIRNDENLPFDENFSHLLQNIFPDMDGLYVSEFLMWMLSRTKEKLLLSRRHFSFSHVLTGSRETDFRKLEEEKINNSIKTILSYFTNVPILNWGNLLTEEQRVGWGDFDADTRKKIVKKLRIEGLKGHKNKFKAIRLDKKNKSAKYRKEFYIEMIDKMIEEIKNH